MQDTIKEHKNKEKTRMTLSKHRINKTNKNTQSGIENKY